MKQARASRVAIPPVRCVLESRSVTHTWGLKGVTPVMSANGKRDHLNVIGGISWAGEIFAQATIDSMNRLGFIAFLESVLARVPGNVVMVLDNSRVHRNAEVVKFVEETDRLEVVFLPAYAPELNPAAQARQRSRPVSDPSPKVLLWGQDRCRCWIKKVLVWGQEIELLWAWVKRHWLANLVVLSVDELRGLWWDASRPTCVTRCGWLVGRLGW